MAQQLPPDPNNLYTLLECLSICVSIIIVIWKWIDSYFKGLKEQKQEFIQNVVIATVKATLDSELRGIKDNISKLFEYREDDRNHTDGQFRELMKEIKK